MNPIFRWTPIWQTETSEFLRLRDVEHVISTSLCDHIWQSFYPINPLGVESRLNQFLKDVSKSLSAFNEQSEAVWRSLTLRSVHALSDADMKSRQLEFTVQQILSFLGPLMVPAQSTEIKDALTSLLEESITLWVTAQKDKCRIVAEKSPTSYDREKWLADDMKTPESLPASAF